MALQSGWRNFKIGEYIMEKDFAGLGLSNQLVEGLQKMKVCVPTEIQAKVIPAALQGKDVVVQSPTGTGKTLAYLLPLLQSIDISEQAMQAVILVPTHELAVQVFRQIGLVASNGGINVSVALVIGGVNVKRQIDKLKIRPQIIVGSGGRILELIKMKKISAQTIKHIVLDEGDRLLDDKNLETIKAVIKTTLRERQIMLFSATITIQTITRAKSFLQAAKIINLLPSPVAMAAGQAVEHMFFLTEKRDKLELLRKLVRNINIEQALVFINVSYDIGLTCEKLNYIGLKSACIHGSSIKAERQKALEEFRLGKLRLLIASDLAARGLDIPNIKYIFNLDLPEDPAMYLHRAGRTGRAGQTGTVISLVDKSEAAQLKKIEKTLQTVITEKIICKGRIINKMS